MVWEIFSVEVTKEQYRATMLVLMLVIVLLVIKLEWSEIVSMFYWLRIEVCILMELAKGMR